MPHNLPQEGRILALDVGDVRTGVARSDGLQMLASPFTTVPAQDVSAATEAVAKIAREEEAVAIVVGLPLHTSGEEGEQAGKVRGFVAELEGLVSVPIILQDERFTTAQVRRTLIDAGMRREKRKQVVDKLAATQILQTFLDRIAAERRRGEAGT